MQAHSLYRRIYELYQRFLIFTGAFGNLPAFHCSSTLPYSQSNPKAQKPPGQQTQGVFKQSHFLSFTPS